MVNILMSPLFTVKIKLMSSHVLRYNLFTVGEIFVVH